MYCWKRWKSTKSQFLFWHPLIFLHLSGLCRNPCLPCLDSKVVPEEDDGSSFSDLQCISNLCFKGTPTYLRSVSFRLLSRFRKWFSSKSKAFWSWRIPNMIFAWQTIRLGCQIMKLTPEPGWFKSWMRTRSIDVRLLQIYTNHPVSENASHAWTVAQQELCFTLYVAS